MVNNYLFTAVVPSTAILSALLSAIATGLVLSQRNTRIQDRLQEQQDVQVLNIRPQPSLDNSSTVSRLHDE